MSPFNNIYVDCDELKRFMKDGLLALSGLDGEKHVPHRLGHFFIAINIESFVPIETFKKITGSIMREIRSTAKVPGQDRIFLAGEKEFDMMETRRKDGIPINKSLQEIMIELRKDLHLGDYDFPFFSHARAAL